MHWKCIKNWKIWSNYFVNFVIYVEKYSSTHQVYPVRFKRDWCAFIFITFGSVGTLAPFMLTVLYLLRCQFHIYFQALSSALICPDYRHHGWLFGILFSS